MYRINKERDRILTVDSDLDLGCSIITRTIAQSKSVSKEKEKTKRSTKKISE